MFNLSNFSSDVWTEIQTSVVSSGKLEQTSKPRNTSMSWSKALFYVGTAHFTEMVPWRIQCSVSRCDFRGQEYYLHTSLWLRQYLAYTQRIERLLMLLLSINKQKIQTLWLVQSKWTKTNTAWHHLYVESKKKVKLIETIEKWLSRK